MKKKEPVIKATKKRSTKSVPKKRNLQKTVVSSSVPVLHSSTHRPQGIDKAVHFTVTVIFTLCRYLIVFLLGAFVTIVIVGLVVCSTYLRTVSASSSLPARELLEIGMSSKGKKLPLVEGRMNMLVLGTDALANRDEESKLTDTVMVVSVSPSTGNITTFSLPRDLWIASQSAKINGLYQRGEQVITSTVEEITSLPIQKTIVIDIATVGKVIDAFGGLDITVERSFVDYRFPRSDVDVRTEHDPNKLYETVAFTKGVEHMSGDRALRYIRSRHSLDPIEGTDDARVRRQQQVISAVIAKVQDPLLIRNPEQIGVILKIYTTDVRSTLSLQEASSLAWMFIENKKIPLLRSHQFTVREVDKNGQLTHPNKFPGGAWVYLPVDTSYGQMRAIVKDWVQN